MKPALRKEVIRNAAWFGGLGLALVLLIGGSVLGLGRRKANIAQLEEDIRQKREELAQGAPVGDLPRLLERTRDALTEWEEMVGSESGRLAELSDAARTAGVRIVSLKNADREAAGEEPILASSHQLHSVGSYSQLAEFLDEIQTARGVAGIDDLEILHDQDAPAGMLVASMEVTWYAADPTAQEESTP